jgi:carboxypeptidase Taq
VGEECQQRYTIRRFHDNTTKEYADAMSAYAELLQREKDRTILGSCAYLLGWDERTYMPPKGVQLRGNQLALLARLNHEMLTAPAVGDLLAKAEANGISEEQKANVREIRRQYDRAVKLPKRLVEEIARATTLGQQAWEQAKTKNDFPHFLPFLETIVKLKREEAQAVGYAQVPYDALLDEFEPGMTTAEATKVLAELRKQLLPFLAQIMGSGKKAPVEIMERNFPVDRQQVFGQAVASAIGFDFAAGRLDVTAHPFCSGMGPGDVRLTTRYNPNHFNEALFGTLHEAGHGIYEQNLPAEHHGTPLGSACSLGIHESQSRLWENFIGRSRAFWNYFFPVAKQIFLDALRDVTLDDFYFAINDVRPSFIRIEADEVTYNLHIILRFELEQALLHGDLAAKDLPGAWNEKFQAAFQMTPPTNARGCLQDIHWSAGLIGYFPTYTLGNLYAAQFMEQARWDIRDLDFAASLGRFNELKDWLAANIHRHGQRYRAPQLCQRITGMPLSPASLMQHLKQKFGPLYGI